jgi:cell wall-associated NlpC family hydrolase
MTTEFERTYADPRVRITHVGIYAGSGRMLNATARVDMVREMPVFVGYWRDHYAGAGRIRE